MAGAGEDMTIDRKKSDIAIQISKGVLGGVPYIGALVAELVDVLIPNQRLDRIVTWVKMLETKVSTIEEEVLGIKMTSVEGIDLFEDCAFQVARAFSDERKEQIASLYKNSLTDEELEHLHYKKLLVILSELSDIEILLLKYHSHSTSADKAVFWEQHKSALEYEVATFGSPRDGLQRVIDIEVIHDSYGAKIVSAGLLEIEYDSDQTQGQRVIGYSVTGLGLLLLRSIDEAINTECSPS